MKTLFYCHNSLGIGHLTRTFKLASGLTSDHQVAVICGGHVPPGLAAPVDVQLLRLPAISLNDSRLLVAEDGCYSLEQVQAVRCEQVVAIASELQPDILVIEMFPFGRKKFAQEIIALINAVRRNKNAKVFSSVRDVLVSRQSNQTAYDVRAVDWLNRYFDALLIHSDVNIVSLAATLTTYKKIQIPIHYTGFVAPKPVMQFRRNDGERFAIVSAGGGRVGQELIQVAANSADLIKEKLELTTLIIKGPNNPLAIDGANRSWRALDFVSDFAALLSQSELSISQCGYNTVTDILAAKVPAVFVPFETPEEDEQLRRANLLASRGRAVCLRLAALTPEALLGAAQQALAQKMSIDVDLNGIENTARILRGTYGK